MSGSPNKRSAQAYFERFLNQGDYDAADEIFAPSVQFHYPLGDLSGLDEVKNYVAAVRIAFPDLRFMIADLIEEQDKVAARWSLEGTQSGTFRNRPPTHQKASVSGLTVFNLQDGVIVEMWVAFDPARLTGN